MTVDLLVISMISDPPAALAKVKCCSILRHCMCRFPLHVQVSTACSGFHCMCRFPLHVQVSTSSMFCVSLAMYNFCKAVLPHEQLPRSSCKCDFISLITKVRECCCNFLKYILCKAYIYTNVFSCKMMVILIRKFHIYSLFYIRTCHFIM